MVSYRDVSRAKPELLESSSCLHLRDREEAAGVLRSRGIESTGRKPPALLGSWNEVSLAIKRAKGGIERHCHREGKCTKYRGDKPEVPSA